MAVITCNSCSARLRVADESAGKRLKCPKCGNRIAVEVPASVVAREAEPPREEPADEPEQTQAVTAVAPTRDTAIDDGPRPKKRKQTRDLADDDWSKPRLGVHLSYGFVCLYLSSVCMVLFGLLVVLLGVAIGWRGVVLSFIFFQAIAGLLNFAGVITYIVGQVFACFAPPRKGARVLAIVSASLCGVTMLGYLISVIGSVAHTPALSLIGMVIFLPTGLAHLIVYLFYLRSLALSVRVKDVAVSIRNFMIAVPVTIVVYPVVAFVVLLLASLLGAATQMSSAGASPEALMFAMGIPMLIVMAIGVILALGGFIWYTRILIGVRDGLDRAMDEPVARSPVWLPLFQGAAALFVVDLVGVIIAGIALRPDVDSRARVNPPTPMPQPQAPVFTPPSPVFPQPPVIRPQPPVVGPQPPPVQPVGPQPLPELAPGRRLQAGVKVHEQTVIRDGVPMRVWVYLPETPSAPKLPCVLIAPAGSPLFIGNGLGAGDRTEHLPYVKAGFAVVAFELDGDVPDLKRASDPQLVGAASAFRKAEAGVANLRTAMDFATQKVPVVDPDRFYTAGHSSAGTFALLAASKEPRVKGAIAYAPCTDVVQRLAKGMPIFSKLMPWLPDFARDTSPLTVVADIKCPVFLFHAADDSNVPITETTTFAAELKKTNQRVTFAQVPRGEHYNSMIQEGIPKGIEWLQTISGFSVAVKPADPMNPMPVNPMPGNPVPGGNTRLTLANMAKVPNGSTRAHAVTVLGTPTTTGPSVRIGKITQQTLTWSEGTAIVTITFRNDRAFGIVGNGLK
jgi:dienelactone hydrolase